MSVPEGSRETPLRTQPVKGSEATEETAVPGQMSAGATEEQVRVIRVGTASGGSGGFIRRAVGVTAVLGAPQTSLWLLRGWEDCFQPLEGKFSLEHDCLKIT